MSKRPRHPIKLPDDEHVSFSELIQKVVKFRPSQNPPGSPAPIKTLNFTEESSRA
jgi:hypothetical protein